MTQHHADSPWPSPPNTGSAGPAPGNPTRPPGPTDTGPIRMPQPGPMSIGAGRPAGPAPGQAYQPWPVPPAPPPSPPAGQSRWSGRLIAAAAGAAVVLIGASVGITLALDHHGGSSAAASAPAARGSAGTATAPAQVGQPSAAALVSGYLQAENNAQGDSLGRYLCGGTGPAADSATEWSWTWIALNEHVTASPLGPSADGGQQVTITVSYQGKPSGEYGALLTQRGSRWCVQAVTNGPPPGGGQ